MMIMMVIQSGSVCGSRSKCDIHVSATTPMVPRPSSLLDGLDLSQHPGEPWCSQIGREGLSGLPTVCTTLCRLLSLASSSTNQSVNLTQSQISMRDERTNRSDYFLARIVLDTSIIFINAWWKGVKAS